MPKTHWNKKSQNNLIVLGVLTATLLAVFLISGARQEVWEKVWEKVWGSAVISWEKSQNKEFVDTKARRSRLVESLQKAEKEVKNLTADLQGRYGIYVEDLETGASFGINQDQVFTAASLIKLPVFVAVYQEVEKGNLFLATSYKLQAKDKVPGAGSMYYAPAGTVYTYEKMLELMGKQSDNTAQNVFVKLLGEEKIQAVIDELGMKDTSFSENETTPEDIGKFFRGVYQGNRVNRENREQIFSFLTETNWEDRIPAGIPKGVRVVHKVGTEMGVYDDAGIVFSERPFVLVIMTEEVKEAEAKEVLPRITLVIYHLHPNP